LLVLVWLETQQAGLFIIAIFQLEEKMNGGRMKQKDGQQVQFELTFTWVQN